MTDDLYREICRTPGDDTLRLAYADWLDEHGDPDRAEFVRAWYELEGMPAYRGIDISLDWSDPKFSPECRRAAHLRRREGELLRLHPDWSRLPCEACDKWGCVMVDTGVDVFARGKAKGGRLYRPGQCDTCHGTGDLFRHRVFDPGLGPNAVRETARTVTFDRGFPDSVSCTLAEAFASDGTPTPWACEVVRRTPVTRFVLTDREPERSTAFGGWFRWYTGPEQNEISDELYHELEGEHPEDRFGPSKQPYWRTADAAVDALALAAGRLVRRYVYGEVAA